MRTKHWAEVVPPSFLRVPCREMLSNTGLRVIIQDGARRSTIPPELRDQCEVIYDKTYIVAWFNNAFARLGIPTISLSHFEEYAQMGLNPLVQTHSDNCECTELQNLFEALNDELATFAAMLPETANASRDSKDYPVRWYHGVKLLEKIENIVKIEFKPRKIDDEVMKDRVRRL